MLDGSCVQSYVLTEEVGLRLQIEITVDINTLYYLDSRIKDGSIYDTIINCHVPAV